MRDKKEEHEQISKFENNQRLEESESGYGLEAVEKGMDFAEGDKSNPSTCGGL
ncbi:hypothetical protein [Bacillus sp. B-jedd]|uniref:hypothetical protein n=1 Tax=Bacillus sp. B-jedd TaxID=1476857 RepID=UPI0005155C5D|nr:hypothetical protein [Bacillus sp. B-jedd]CEG26396.1 hypothetical protein BN1002_01241 [Bacillus sp. B-jedd]